MYFSLKTFDVIFQKLYLLISITNVNNNQANCLRNCELIFTITNHWALTFFGQA